MPPSFPRSCPRPVAARPDGLAVLLLLLFLCAAGLPACGRSKDAAEPVRALMAREVAAINSADLKGLSEVWEKDDAALLFDLPEPGRFRGWKAIEPVWKSFFERFSDIHMGVDKVELTASGDLAYATYDWTLSGRMGDYALDDRGAATEVFRRGPEGWRIVHLHYSVRVPEGPEPAPAGQAKPQEKPSKTPAPR